MKPPKCKSCGKEEWRHVCGNVRFSEAFVHDMRKALAQAVVSDVVQAIKDGPTKAAVDAFFAAKPSRKEYLKLKARERRARQKAAKSGKDAH